MFWSTSVKRSTGHSRKGSYQSAFLFAQSNHPKVSEDMGWFYLNLLSSSWIYLRRFSSLGNLSESVNNFLRLKRSCCFLSSNSFAKRSLSLRSAAAFSNFNRVVGVLLWPKLRSGTLSAFWLNSYMLSQSIIGLSYRYVSQWSQWTLPAGRQALRPQGLQKPPCDLCEKLCAPCDTKKLNPGVVEHKELLD